MRNLFSLTIISAMLTTSAASGQVPPPNVHVVLPNQPDAEPNLPRFNLDFPGGTPSQLVKAIEKASGKPINVIIPSDAAEAQLPPLKMTGVTVASLFEALTAATMRSTPYRTQRNGGISFFNTAQQFRTEGPRREDSVWFFTYSKPPEPIEAQKDCRYYQLAPYLETYKVEDIITAIETGWKMLGITSTPKLSFHKETKLLIAVGSADDLKLIDDVLKQLAAKADTTPTTPSPAKK